MAAAESDLESVQTLLPLSIASAADINAPVRLQGRERATSFDRALPALAHAVNRTGHADTAPASQDEEEQLRVVKHLLAHKADPNAKGEQGIVALHCAHTPDVVDVLIDGGAAIEAKDDRGVTPLGRAYYNGRWLVVKQLLQRGAQVPKELHRGIKINAKAHDECDRIIACHRGLRVHGESKHTHDEAKHEESRLEQRLRNIEKHNECANAKLADLKDGVKM